MDFIPTFDFGKRDIVSVTIPDNDEDRSKLRSFIRSRFSVTKASPETVGKLDELVKVLCLASNKLTIVGTGATKKTNTEFASVVFTNTPGSIRFDVQMRYLTLVGRKSKHRATDIFSRHNPRFDEPVTRKSAEPPKKSNYSKHLDELFKKEYPIPRYYFDDDEEQDSTF